MAQTVGLQRGATSITWNGTTAYTLFTNTASGTATRVVLGGISAYNSGLGPLGMALFVKQASTSNYVTIGFKGFGAGNSGYSLDFFGGCAPLPLQPTASATDAMGSTILTDGSSANYFGAQDIANVNISYLTTTASYGSSRFNFEFYPQQFWIGPSDVVVMKFYNYNNSSATGNVAYNFVTITES